MARTCSTIMELREKMGEQFGRHPVQLTLFVPSPQRPADSPLDTPPKKD
jgi:hypothetical protein